MQIFYSSTAVTLQALTMTDCQSVCVFSIVSWSFVSIELCFDLAVYVESQAPGEERHTDGGNLRLSVTMLQVN